MFFFVLCDLCAVHFEGLLLIRSMVEKKTTSLSSDLEEPWEWVKTPQPQ